ncbi:MAG: aldehyde dehydrogenase family protein [Planctomycetes bacterium]|nr:aldehyde dehydrogenase family protein [Planctomycetota bacterium]
MDKDLEAIREVRSLVARAKKAQEALDNLNQEETDRIAGAMADAACREAERLARLAVEDTGMGTVEGKTQKNVFSSRDLWTACKGLKTVGVLAVDAEKQVIELGEPVGVIAGIIPCTNPTSTAMYKAIIALKARNAIVISPHPRAVKCIQATVDVVEQAARRTGAPPDCVTCQSLPFLEATGHLMRHADVAVILATGGSGLVTAAYSSGRPAFGVGPGNVPVYIDRTADPAAAVRAVIRGKTFDYGTVCASEQAIIVDAPLQERVREEFVRQGCHVATPEEAKRLAATVIKGSLMNPAVVGQSAFRIAEMAGIQVPRETKALLAELTEVGPKAPLSREKLCPVLALYAVPDWRQGLALTNQVLEFGGLGHTVAVHAQDTAVVQAFAFSAPSFRIVVNGPTTQGAIGLTTGLFPAMTLGCGTYGGNITSDNIGPKHLINVKRVAFTRPEPGEGGASGGAGGGGGAAWNPVEALRAYSRQPKQAFPAPVVARPAAGSKAGAAPSGGASVQSFLAAFARPFVCPVTQCPESSRSACHGCG